MKGAFNGVLSCTYRHSYINYKNIRFWQQKLILILSKNEKHLLNAVNRCFSNTKL